MLSRVPLDLDNSKSPLYPTAEHVTPGKDSAGYMVVASAINDMKSDLDLDEFKKVLPLLGRIVSKKGTEKDWKALAKAM
jgi:hypothetical protein